MNHTKAKKPGILRSVYAKTPVRDGPARERTWEARSDISDGVLVPGMMNMENTYKLRPDDDKKFRPGKVEQAMNEILSNHLSDMEYDKTVGQRMSKMLSDLILKRVKEFKWTRYKLVAHVIIGENREQDIVAGSRFLWFDETDTYASTKYVNKSIFALAVCYGVYYE